MNRKFSELSISEQSLFNTLTATAGQAMTVDTKMGLVQQFGLDVNDPVVLGFLTGVTQPQSPTTQTEQKPTKSKEMSYANSQHLIVIQNRLLHAISDLTLYERRLILFLSPMVRKEVSLDKDKKEFIVRVSDFAKEYNLKGKYLYSELEKIAKDIQHKVIDFWDYRLNSKQELKKAKARLSWVTRAQYFGDEGEIFLQLHEEVIEMLTIFDKTTGNYWTQYQKEWITKLGVYGIVMLEMVLGSFESKGYYTIEHLREKFDCVESYNSFSDFKRYVLDKAIKEVHKHTPIRIDYEQDKTGRSIKGLVFSFTDTRPKELPKPNTKNPKDGTKDQNPFTNFKMTKKQLSFFANKIKQASGQDIDEIMDELSNVHLQSKHIAFLKVLDFIPTEWYTEEEIKDHLTQEQIDELKQTLKKSAKSQEEQEQIKLEQDFYKILQYAKSFVLANKDLINRATIEGFYLQQKDYDAIVQLWKDRLTNKEARRQFVGLDEILGND